MLAVPSDLHSIEIQFSPKIISIAILHWIVLTSADCSRLMQRRTGPSYQKFIELWFLNVPCGNWYGGMVDRPRFVFPILTRDAGPKTTHSMVWPHIVWFGHGVFSASPRKARAGPTS